MLTPDKTGNNIQKAADAAFFEDWSEWHSLDDLPPVPRDWRGRRVTNNGWQQYTRYGLELRHNVPWMGGPAFEIMIPSQEPMVKLLKRVPGLRQHPALSGTRRVQYQSMETTWFVPASEWRALRAVLPALKRLVANYVRHRP